jgi:hypothetical protein
MEIANHGFIAYSNILGRYQSSRRIGIAILLLFLAILLLLLPVIPAVFLVSLLLPSYLLSFEVCPCAFRVSSIIEAETPPMPANITCV